jgi:rhomboid-like protein
LQGAKDAQATLNHLPETLSFLPNVLLVPILRIYITSKEYLLNSHPASTVPVQLAVGMGTVFLAWKVRRWEPFMRKWFLHRPVIFTSSVRAEWTNCVTMFTSTVRPV